MVRDRAPDPGLGCVCPKCGQTHRAESLAKLTKLVAGCRKQKPVTGPPPARPADINFLIPYAPLSVNDTFHAHWREVHREKKKWRAAVEAAVKGIGPIDLWYSDWTITRFYGPRGKEMDYANYVGSVSLKAAIDYLVTSKILRDDSPTHFKAEYLQQPADKPGVRFKLNYVRNQTD